MFFLYLKTVTSLPMFDLNEYEWFTGKRTGSRFGERACAFGYGTRHSVPQRQHQNQLTCCSIGTVQLEHLALGIRHSALRRPCENNFISAQRRPHLGYAEEKDLWLLEKHCCFVIWTLQKKNWLDKWITQRRKSNGKFHSSRHNAWLSLPKRRSPMMQ